MSTLQPNIPMWYPGPKFQASGSASDTSFVALARFWETPERAIYSTSAMAVVEDALSSVCLHGNALVSLGGGCYTRGTRIIDDRDFATKLDQVQRRVGEWTELLRIGGKSADPNLLRVVGECSSMIRREEVRLRKYKSMSCLTCWANPRPLKFPEDLIQSLEKIISTFDELSIDSMALEGPLDPWEDDASASQQLLGSRLPFRPDARFVAHEETMSELRERLENVCGARIVVLHGKTGIGKSNVARQLALEYQIRSETLMLDEQLNWDSSMVGTQTVFGFPDGVLYLDCGAGADVQAKHLKLLQMLGASPALLDEDPSASDAFHTNGSIVRKRLENRLKDKRVLIVVDDVCDVGFLERFILPGARYVKYLATSELEEESWLGQSDVELVELKAMGLERAQKVLANHVGFPEGKIPPHLQEIADEIIRSLEFTPLLLANVAIVFSKQQKEDEEKWDTVKKRLLSLMSQERVSVVNFEYPRIAVSSLTMAIDSLSYKPRSLLLLGAALRGPTIPEVALKILFRKHNGNLNSFSELRKYLEDRELIRIQDKKASTSTWWIHRMRREFIVGKSRQELQWILDCIFSDSAELDGNLYTAEEKLLATLCALYGDPLVSETGFEKLRIRFDTGDLRRHAMEPLLWLLDVDRSKEWKVRAYRLARQIFLRYICHGQLDDESLSKLLAMPQTVLTACAAAEAIANAHREALLRTPESRTVRGLLTVISSADSTTIQRAAASALAALAVNNHEMIIDHPLILDVLMELLDKETDPLVQGSALFTIGNLAQSSESIATIGTYPGMLERLVDLLDDGASYLVVTEATYTLARLTSLKGTVHAEVAAYSLAVERLLHLLLSHHVSEETKRFAVWTIANLAWATENTLDLTAFPKTLEAMVGLLANDLNPEVQEQAAGVLEGLANASHENRIRIGGEPEIIDGLVRLLMRKENEYHVEDAVASALNNLGQVPVNRRKIASVPGLLNRLVELLVEDVSMGERLHTPVVRLLATLSEVNGEIAELPGSVQTLVVLLRYSSPEVLLHAAKGLANIAAQRESNKLMIAAAPGAVDGLANLLSMDLIPELQNQALRALANLASAPGNKARIIQCEGLVDRLQQFLGAEAKPNLQLHAARAFTLLEPVKSAGMTLFAVQAFYGRGEALMERGMYKEAAADLDQIAQLKPRDTFCFRRRSFVRAMMKDLEGALIDADKVVELAPLVSGHWQERGVLKQMNGDLEGALNDLERALELTRDDYECLKYRGYVKFLMGEESGAREDAERALQVYSTPAHESNYRSRYLEQKSLKFLGYEFR